MSDPQIAVVEAPIDAEALSASVRSDANGAVVTFCGVVRATSDDDRRVVGLKYEAYPAMARREMESIGREAQRRSGPLDIAIVHRVGELCVGETSIVIAVGSPHRRAAFEACAYAIDELKTRVEVWKQERYADGDSTWRENAASEEAHAQ